MGGYRKLDWVSDILQWEECTTLPWKLRRGQSTPFSLSVPPRDLNGKPLKITTRTLLTGGGRKGKRGGQLWDSCGDAAQKVDCLWGENIGNVSIHFDGQESKIVLGR